MLPVATKTALADHRELAEHARQLTTYCHTHGADVEVIGAAPLNTRPRTYNPGPGQNIWTVTTLEDDPLIRRGEMAIPTEQLKNLKKIDDAGVEFTELLIAHELPPDAIPMTRHSGWRNLDSYDLTVLEYNARLPEPVETRHETQQIGDRIEHAARRTIDGFTQLASHSKNGAVTSAVTARKTATSFANTLAKLDPIIIGATTASGESCEGEPAVYYVLARWDW